MLIEVIVDDTNGLTSFRGDRLDVRSHDKLEEIITSTYLNELTCSSWEPFKKRGDSVAEKEEDGCCMEDVVPLL